MKKWIVVLILIFVETVCAELTILKTEFNRAPLNIVEEEANKGVAEAQAELAFRYYAGHQVAKNQTASFEWMSKAAGKKHLGALLALSQMYVEGIGIAVDPQKAEDVFISAIIVGTGDARIQPMFDRWVENKKNSGGNVQEFMKKCADSGYGPAYSAVYYPVAMEFYQKGQYEQALPLLVELSRHGDSMGTFYLAQMYAKGEGSLPQDAVEAFALYQQAATNGNGLAQVELAAMYSAGLVVEPDAEMVRFWLNEAAEQGQREAQYKLAELEFAAAVAAEDSIQLPNEVGQRVKKEFEQRMDRAVFWYKAAAEQSHPDALYMLGRLYASGDHVLQDFSKAVHYYQAAVAQGHNEALFYLGLMHHAGIGVEKDVPAAVSFYQQAATQGVTGALYYLGNGYRSGIGVQQNLVKGEGIYYGKILKMNIPANLTNAMQHSVLTDPWFYQAAREYAVISWNKASTPEKFDDALRYAALAAKAGDVAAADLLTQMNEQLLSQATGDGKAVQFVETPVNARADAVLRRRDRVQFPYVIRKSGDADLDPTVKKGGLHVTVRERGVVNAAGESLVELSVKYVMPAKSASMDDNRILLLGVELFDSTTGKKYWSFVERQMPSAEYTVQSYYDVSVFIDKTAYPNVQVNDWVALYGVLLRDGVTLVLFDQAGSIKASENIANLMARNTHSCKLDAKLVVAFDVDLSIDDETGLKRSDLPAAIWEMVTPKVPGL